MSAVTDRGGPATFTFWVAGSLGRPVVPDEVGHEIELVGEDTLASYREAWLTAAWWGAGRYEMVTRVELVAVEL